MVILPTDAAASSTSFEQRIELSNVVTTLKIYWNNVEEAWFLDISTDSATIIQGIKLVQNIFLLEEFSLYFPGDFILYDTEDRDDGARVDYEALGVRFQLFYLSKEEIEA